MAPRSIFPLKFKTVCAGCGETLEPGTMARRMPDKLFRCMPCAPVVRLSDARAEGAVDSSKKPMMTMAQAKSIAMGSGDNPQPGKRRRLPSGLRRSHQHRNNT